VIDVGDDAEVPDHRLVGPGITGVPLPDGAG
jgi:hypothetical protein